MHLPDYERITSNLTPGNAAQINVSNVIYVTPSIMLLINVHANSRIELLANSVS